uniref:Secreted protein n=1 Tax=Oryza brachyantha TaxID=4533 RepID=J3L9P7_ORYBR
MCPVKLLLLALIATRFLIFSHVDGNFPVNLLLEIFSTFNGLSDTDEFSSCRCPLRRLKLTSRTTILPEDISSSGKAPESELYDRLRRDKLVTPSHAQQSVPFRQDMEMPSSCDSPARNWRRERFSCSRHAMVEVAMESS